MNKTHFRIFFTEIWDVNAYLYISSDLSLFWNEFLPTFRYSQGEAEHQRKFYNYILKSVETHSLLPSKGKPWKIPADLGPMWARKILPMKKLNLPMNRGGRINHIKSKQIDAVIPAVLNHLIGPEGNLNLADVGLFKYEHAQS